MVGEARRCPIWIERSRSTVEIVEQGFQVGELRSEREREVARVVAVVGRGGCSRLEIKYLPLSEDRGLLYISGVED